MKIDLKVISDWSFSLDMSSWPVQLAVMMCLPFLPYQMHLDPLASVNSCLKPTASYTTLIKKGRLQGRKWEVRCEAVFVGSSRPQTASAKLDQ